MKEKLKQIIEKYFGKKDIEINYNFLLDNTLLIIKNKEGEELDFFYFIFSEDKEIDNLKSEDIFKNLLEKDNKLKEIPSFDKNLNFIYFIKTDNYSVSKELREKAHLIEENPYYAKEKVIFYTDELVNSFENYDLDISGIKEIYEDMSDDIKFLLDLLVGLTFIKIDFKKENKGVKGKNNENLINNIFEESFNEILKEYSVNINSKENGLELFTEDEEDFRNKIEEINRNNFGENINNNDITNFEKKILSLFGEGKEKLEKEILSLKIIDNENTKNGNL